jgi:hypothetical protein
LARRRTVRKAWLVVVAVAAATALSGCAIGFRGPALGVTHITATLTGDVMSNRTEPGTYWFRYGKTTSYGQETPHQPIDFTAGVRQGVTEPIESLEPATTYHYSLCAEDQDPAFDALCSADSTFTTRGDSVNGSVGVLTELGFGIFTFNDVRSGPGGEDPVGSITFGPLGGPVTCLRVTGDSRVTVGAESVYFFFDLPATGTGLAAAESVGDPSVCPADPAAWSGQAGRLPGFSMHDDPAP